MKSLGIVELLALRGFDRNSRFKLVRHKDENYDVPTLLRDGWFERSGARATIGEIEPDV